MPHQRWMAIGCTHGECLDQDAFDVVMGFESRWQPHRKFLLGDIYDFAAFRAGSKGTSDEARRLDPDLKAGNDIIERYRPTDVLIGNHDHRVFKLSEHPNALIARAAQSCRTEFYTSCKAVGVRNLIDHYDITRSWIEWAGYKWLHGFMYSEQSLRDHSEHFGSTIMAHLHTPGMARGRRVDSPTAYCVGFLGDVKKLEYAHGRRATSRWELGFLWGEATETEMSYVQIAKCPNGQAKNWRLPL